jgi:hypothetical protein
MNYKWFDGGRITVSIPGDKELIQISEGIYEVIDRELYIKSKQGSSNTPVLLTNQTEKPQIYWEI